MMRARRLFLLASVLILAGCAGMRWVPLPDGATIDPAARSATQSRDGVTITVQASAWQGSPVGLEAYVTPMALHVVNGTGGILRIGPEDLALFDEARRQSTPMPPERVAAIFRRVEWPGVPHFRLALESEWPILIGHRRVMHDPLPRPFFWSPWWWDPWPPPERVDDLFTQALPFGRIYPGAQIRGFVYFSPVDPAARRLALRVGYSWEGGQSPSGEMLFLFAAESSTRGGG